MFHRPPKKYSEYLVNVPQSIDWILKSIWKLNAGGGSQNLQEVTDAGNTTTNTIDVAGTTTDFVQLDTTATPTLQPGMFGWDDAYGTADLRLKGNNVTLQVGQETLARVVNKTGADLLESEYKVVRVRIASEGGAQGQRLAVVLAQGNNDPDSATTMGIVTENIANNQEGFITVFGNVNGINTTGSLQGETWVDGDVLYLSPTTPGGLTKVKPIAPQHTVIVGYVVYAHNNQGKIFVKVDNGYELDELHNVKITSVANNDLLQYDSSIQVWKNSAISSILPNGLLKIASAISTTFQAVTDYLGNASVLFLNSRRIGIGKDTSVTTQSVAVVEVQDTNTSIVLKPNGTGGIIASVPDGTATGGNARGSYAVDLQMERSAANKVASATYTTIGGGKSNLVSGSQGTVSGGAFNTVTSNSGVICGGSENTNNSSGGVIVGGQYNSTGTLSPGTFIGGGGSNTNSSSYGVISGGQSNTASTNTHATVVGGQNNTASGLHSVTGGASNTASGQASFVANGGNTVSGGYSAAFGFGTNVSGNSALGFGGYALAYLEAQLSQGSGRFAATGDAQNSVVIARRQADLTTGATATLSLSGNGTTLLIIPNGNNRLWKVKVEWNAIITTITGTATGLSVGNSATGESNFYFKRVGGTSSIGSFINDSESTDNAIMDTCSLSYAAGASQELALTFTAPTFAGGGSVTIRTVAKISLTEVAY